MTHAELSRKDVEGMSGIISTTRAAKLFVFNSLESHHFISTIIAAVIEAWFVLQEPEINAYTLRNTKLYTSCTKSMPIQKLEEKKNQQ